MKRVFFLCLFSYVYVYSQSDLTGTVTDEKGLPLIGANVYIEQSFRGTITGIGGGYVIKNLRNGTYVIRASYIGFNSESKEIILDGDRELDFILTKANIIADEVVVRATRADEKTPVAYTNVSREEIQEKNLGQDLPFLLNLSPSMVISSDAGSGIGYTNFRIRGTDLNRINVTVNGIPLNDAESHGVWFVDLPDFVSSVDNIQIQRGVGTSTNGAAAFGATMNFQTFTLNREPYAELNSSFGSFNTWKNTLSAGSGLLNDHFTFNVRLSKISSDGYIDRAFSDLKSYSVSGGYYGEKTMLKVNLFSGLEKTYQAWWGVPGDQLQKNRTFNPAGMIINEGGDTSFYENETDNYQQDHYQLLFTRELNKKLFFNLALHYTYGRGYYEEYRQDQYFADYHLADAIIGGDTINQTDLVRQKWLDNDFYGFVYSLNYKYGKIDAYLGGGWNRYDGRHFGKLIWSQLASNFDINHEWYRSTGHKTDANIYLKVDIQINRQLSLYGDLQYRYIEHRIRGVHDDLRNISQIHNFKFINPKFGISYDIANHQNLYFSLGAANREPNRANFVDADPNHPAPVHERLTDYEMGYTAKFTRGRIEANLYYMDYANQLVLTGEINDVGAPIMTNIKDSYRTGIEFITIIRPIERIQWDLNLTLNRSRIKKFTEYVDNWDYWSDPGNEPYQYENELGETDISFSPGIMAGSQLSYGIVENLKVNLSSKYVGKQYIDNTSSEERMLDPYFVNDIGLIFDFKTRFIREISFNLLINNVFNFEYETNGWVYRYYLEKEYRVMDGYFPQAGTNFLAGVTIRF